MKMLSIFVAFIICALNKVAVSERVTSDSSDITIYPQVKLLWPLSVFGARQSTRNYTQGEMADDDKVDPTQIRVLDIVVYTLLFAIGAPANFKIIKCLIWSSDSVKLYRKSRHHFLLFNLAIADAIVLFIVLPTEVLWRVTASWRAGNIGCKLFQFFRVFGLYASSMILICISFDRYYAVVKPFKYSSAANRISRLLKASWILSALFSIPQLYFFRLQNHPNIEFNQCVTFDTFEETWLEKVYAIFNVTVLYGLPLLVILICYVQICMKSFSRKNCKPGKRPSGLMSTNEALGASSIVMPQGDATERLQHEEGEDSGDDDDEEEERESHGGLKTEERVQLEASDAKSTRGHIIGGNFHATVNEAKVSLDAVKISSEEGEEGSKKKNEIAPSSAPAEEEDDANTVMKDDRGQGISMSNLPRGNSSNHNESNANLAAHSLLRKSGAGKKLLKSPSREDEKISEVLVSGKCSIGEGVNYSTSILTGQMPQKSRYKKQSAVRRSILRQTLVIILAFIICWTPYTTLVIWYQCDRDGYKQSGHQLIEMFWLFAVSNSTVNPFIYGKFVKSKRQK